MRVPYFLERKNATFPDVCGKMVLNETGQADTAVPKLVKCSSASAENNAANYFFLSRRDFFCEFSFFRCLFLF